MFNFYVDLADCDMITDAGWATKSKRKLKAHDYKQSIKDEGHLENMSFNGKNFENFRQKKEQKKISRPSKKPSGTPGP